MVGAHSLLRKRTLQSSELQRKIWRGANSRVKNGSVLAHGAHGVFRYTPTQKIGMLYRVSSGKISWARGASARIQLFSLASFFDRHTPAGHG
jgi:hypothetical protein